MNILDTSHYTGALNHANGAERVVLPSERVGRIEMPFTHLKDIEARRNEDETQRSLMANHDFRKLLTNSYLCVTCPMFE